MNLSLSVHESWHLLITCPCYGLCYTKQCSEQVI